MDGPRIHAHTDDHTKLVGGKRADPHESGEWSASNTKRTSVRPADDGGVPYIRYDRIHERAKERERGGREKSGGRSRMGEERKGARDDDGIKWNKERRRRRRKEKLAANRYVVASSTVHVPLGSGTDDFPGSRSKGRPHVRVNSHRVIFHEPFRFVDGRPREE